MELIYLVVYYTKCSTGNPEICFGEFRQVTDFEVCSKIRCLHCDYCDMPHIEHILGVACITV